MKRNTEKKVLSLLLSIFMILGMTALTAVAADDNNHSSNEDRQEENEQNPSLTFTITYDPNGGTGTAYSTENPVGDEVTLLTDDDLRYTRPGYTFLGWSTNPNGTADDIIDPNRLGDLSDEEGLTLFAIWQPNELTMPTPVYTVTFESNGGSEVAPQSISEHDLAAEPSKPVYAGYEFIGWYTGGRQPKLYDFTKTVTESMTLYARWGEQHEAYISGYENGTFRPEINITRGEAAQMLYNIAGELSPHESPDEQEDPETGDDPMTPETPPVNDPSPAISFSDLDTNEWFYNAVIYLAENQAISGYDDGTFRPYEGITRAEFATMIVRYAKLEMGAGSSFSDVPKDYWGITYIGGVSNAGVVAGYTDGTFRPEKLIIRAEAVTMLNNLLGNDAGGMDFSSVPNPFSDVKVGYWAFQQIMECAVSHMHPLPLKMT